MKFPSIRKSDLIRFAEVAKSEGVTIEIEAEGVVFRISPATPASLGNELARELAEFRSHREREPANAFDRAKSGLSGVGGKARR